MDSALYIVGTPIGNLGDVTLRAVETLRSSSLILAEDTRITRRLLARFDIHAPMRSCHKFSEAARADEVVSKILGGDAVSLVTDSGMPCVSDPGARIVSACRAAGAPIRVIPGPSAVPSALALSGYGAGGFSFAGFLPHKSGARARRLTELLARDEPVVLFESPFRFHRLMDELAAADPRRRICICREMTKQFEETIEGPAGELHTALAERKPRGEYTIVISPAAAGPAEPSPAP